MSDESQKTVTLPSIRGVTFDLAKLNKAMDLISEKGSEEAARYALMHTLRWSATDAVDYARAARSCFEDEIDPNDLKS